MGSSMRKDDDGSMTYDIISANGSYVVERGWIKGVAAYKNLSKLTKDVFDVGDGDGDGDVTDVSPSVPPYVKALMYVAYATITVLAVGGNGIVVYIVFAYQKMRSVTNFFIVNLAVGDILMAGLCVPFTFVSNLVLFYWPFGAVLCPIVTYAQAVTVFISAYTMVAISIDRYIAIIYPLRPRMTKLQAKVCILLVWTVALVTPLPTAIKSRLHRPATWRSDDHYYICTEVWETSEQHYGYSMLLSVLQYLFPLAALIFTYARIAVVVWGKRAPGEAQDSRDQRLAASKIKMVKMMITVVLIFTLCWLPFNTLLLVGQQDDSIWSLPGLLYVWFALHWLAMSHTCCNPIIYCWMNARFRDGFWRVFRHCARTSRVARGRRGGGGGGFGGGSAGPGNGGAGGGGGGGGGKKRQKDDQLRRCNTYTTSYTSVRTASSIRGYGQPRSHLTSCPNKSSTTTAAATADNHNVRAISGHNNHHHNCDLRNHVDEDEQSEMLMLKGGNSSQDRDQFQSGFDDDATSETNI